MSSTSEFIFLEGGGELGGLIRSKDWSKTYLGDPAGWPQSLRTTLGIILNTKFPMFLWWGDQLTCFYNDAYRPSLGNEGKHPSILGMPAKDAWTEIWDTIKPLIDKVIHERESVWFEDMLVPIYRNGKMEDVYWTFSYSPVPDDFGKVGGVLVTVTEVTRNVETRKKLKESKRLYEAITQSTPDLIYVFDLNYRFVYANEALLKMWGRSWDESIGKRLLEVGYEPWHAEMHEREIDEVMATKKSIRGTVTFPHATLGRRVYDYIFVPVMDGHGQVEAIAGTTRDVTQQVEAHKQLEDSDDRLRNLIQNAPFPIGVFVGKEMKIEVANESIIRAWGKGQDVVGKLFHEILPELENQGIFEQLQEVYSTGKPLHEYNRFLSLVVDGTEQIYYYNYSFTPLLDSSGKVYGVMNTASDVTELNLARKRLEKSEEQFSTLADNMENLAWLADGEGSIYWYNKRWLEYTGRTLEEMQGWGWQKVHHPDHVDRIVELSKKIWGTNKTFELIFPLRRHDGEYRWFLTRGYPVTNEEGNIIRWIGTNTDITEQKEAEEQFKILADQAPMWVWLTDTEVNILYTNPEVLKFLQISDYKEFTGTMWEQKVHPDEISMVYHSFKEATLLKQSFSFECRIFNTVTQQYEWFYIKAVPRLESGEFTGFIGTGLNINDQKSFANQLVEKVNRRTAELKASEEKFYTLFNLSPICKTLTDPATGKIIMVNDAFTSIFGYGIEEPLHKTAVELGILDVQSHEELLAQLKVHGKIKNKEIDFTSKSGAKLTALISAETIRTGGEEYYVAAYNDITDIKNAEQHIKQKNLELERMNKELESFAYISSHDLQEPLRKIQTFATRIAEKEANNLSESGKDMFSRMQDSAKRMQALIQDLLVYSRTNTQDSTFEFTDLNHIIDEVKEDLQEDLQDKSVTLEVSRLDSINIIPFQFRQLMHNLIGNAIKFSRPGQPPVIQIKSEMAQGHKLQHEKLLPHVTYCHITVSDNGIGFEQQYGEVIFEVFQRLHGKNEYNGTGIGLSIVKKIVENHRGIITASGELNKGAVFDIYIPVL